MAADPSLEFVRKLEELLKEYDFTLIADNTGDINLYGSSGHLVGYWLAELTVEEFRRLA